MAKVLIQNDAAVAFNLLSARLSITLGRPVKYSEAAEILSTADDEMLACLAERYRFMKRSARNSTEIGV